MPNDRVKPKTAFVFAGGGSFGAIQVGMLPALASHGIVADMVFGGRHQIGPQPEHPCWCVPKG